MLSRGQRWGDARDLRREHLGGPNRAKPVGQRQPAGLHEFRVNLVVDEAIDFKDAAAQVLPLGQDACLQCFHMLSFGSMRIAR